MIMWTERERGEGQRSPDAVPGRPFRSSRRLVAAEPEIDEWSVADLRIAVR